MQTKLPNPPSRPAWLALAVAMTMVGAGVVVATALAMNGGPETARFAALALGVGSIAGLAPAVLAVKPDSWGIVVFGGSIARMMLVLLAGYLIDNGQQLDRRPFWMGLVAGAVFVLIAETGTAISVLVKIERARAITGSLSSSQSTNSPAVPAGTERSQA